MCRDIQATSRAVYSFSYIEDYTKFVCLTIWELKPIFRILCSGKIPRYAIRLFDGVSYDDDIANLFILHYTT
jgi:hypothetical protein